MSRKTRATIGECRPWVRNRSTDIFHNRVPQLYATDQDATSPTNTYTVVPSDHRFYYFLDRSFKDVPVAPFPEGLRMLVGNMSAKSYAETGLPEKALTL